MKLFRFRNKIFTKIGITVLVLSLLLVVLNILFPLKASIEYSTIITDNKGEVIHAFLTSDDKWRMKTELEEISPLLRKTIVEKEDKHFFRHPGINPFSMARAVANNVIRGKRTSGASTITMQVARALEPKKRNYFNKLKELFRALQLEWYFSKNEILCLYLNLVPYGGNVEGVKSAAVLYFNKNPDHLSLAEIVSLSIIPNRPSSLVMGKNNDRIVAARNVWLQRFAKKNLFPDAAIRDALSEPLTASRNPVPKLIPHLALKLKNQGGDIIHSTIDMQQQWKVEKLVSDYSRRLSLQNIRNAAIIVIDNHTQQVVSYAGSADFSDTTDGGQVNGAAAVRQPGSTLKPLLYALCVDEGLMTPRSMLSDVAISYNGYAPENYDRQFHGAVTMEHALDQSLNIPAVKALGRLGVDALIQRLAVCDFRQIKRDQQKLGLSMILGGCGATLEELTGLYAAFAHEGLYKRPLYKTGAPEPPPKRIVSAAAAYMINEALSKVGRPDFPLNWQSTERMPKISWKTGTSYGRRDAWSIGYNRNFTVGVWVGNFSGQGIPELSGANVATPLLFRIFNTIDYDSDQEWFRQPEEVSVRKVCSETGMVPAESCTNLVTDYFIPLVSNTTPCNHLKEVFVSADEKFAYCQTCVPSAGFKKKMFRNVETDLQAYLDENRIAYNKLPPHYPDCERIFREGAPLITSPKNGSEYLISKNNREPIQLATNAANDVTKVYWYINNRFYKTGSARGKLFFVPEEGPVKISCSDDKGRNRDVWITVKYVDL
jgi:penicillin-binding protein 1C